MENIKQLAIIGSTASGKTSLAVKVAKHIDAYILSLDSLSIYKNIDIVSAKPSKEEQEGIQHFGIDCIYPNEDFDVTTFIKLYNEVVENCLKENKNLVIVGGTGFYLKMLIEGVSELPNISGSSKKKTSTYLTDLSKAYKLLYSLDPEYMSKIESNDSYRIEKALDIYFETRMIPSEYFSANSPIPTIRSSLPIYQIEWDRDVLRKRIALRTKMMIEDGLIDEICMLEKKYTRKSNCMKAIGIKETLAYLDGIYTKDKMIEKITTNTARLAKRQITFNNSQFDNVIKGSVEQLENILLSQGRFTDLI
jgi:tRNA dimethylallyltransferase